MAPSAKSLHNSRDMVQTSPNLYERTTAEASETPRFMLSQRLFAPVDIAPLVFFRITFGLLMVIEIAAYTFSGYLRQHWIDLQIHFTYYGFGWVAPPPGNWLYALAGVLMLSAASFMLGFYYRLSATILALGLTWLFLIEQANYLNHFYLICLLAFVSIILPANRALSVDRSRKPALRADTVPAWTVWILQAHIAMAYFYGGLAKINIDWLNAAPIRVWFNDGVPAQRVPDFFKNEFVYYSVSYSGCCWTSWLCRCSCGNEPARWPSCLRFHSTSATSGSLTSAYSRFSPSR